MKAQMENYSFTQYKKDIAEGRNPDDLGFVEKKWFMAVFERDTGVRSKVANEYYKIHLDCNSLEERDFAGELYFRIKGVQSRYEEEQKKNAQVLEGAGKA